MLLTSTAKTADVVCVQNQNSNSYSARIIDDSFFWLQDDYGTYSPVYKTFAACMSDRARYLVEASAGAPGHVVGGLCEIGTSPDAFGKFKIFIIGTP